MRVVLSLLEIRTFLVFIVQGQSHKEQNRQQIWNQHENIDPLVVSFWPSIFLRPKGGPTNVVGKTYQEAAGFEALNKGVFMLPSICIFTIQTFHFKNVFI